MSHVIRQATAGDAGIVLALVRALATYEREPDKVVMTEQQCQAALAAGHLRALLALDGQTPVAMALWFFNFSSWTGRRGLYLEDLFIVPESRGTGLGLDLLRMLAQLAVAEGCGRMEWAVLDWNESAKGFYRKIGAARADGWESWRVEGAALASLGAGLWRG